tara:strand:- start:282 stop:533 length:252 start_codon:yes stop_codon:yes gene_type:complete
MAIYNSYTYVIINKSEVSSLDYSKLLITGPNGVRYSLDESKAIVKYSGDQPSELSGKTTYTHEEILRELEDNTSFWNEEPNYI